MGRALGQGSTATGEGESRKVTGQGSRSQGRASRLFKGEGVVCLYRVIGIRHITGGIGLGQ